MDEKKEAERQDVLASSIEDNLEDAGENAKSTKTRADVMREKNIASREREARIMESQKQIVKDSSIETIRRTRRILIGTVVGCEEIASDDQVNVFAALLMKEDKTVKMCVAFNDMYNGTPPIDMSTVDLTTQNGRNRFVARQKQMLSKMIGLDIPVCISQVIKNYDGEGHDYIFASRKDACENIRNRYYFAREPRIVDGEMYDATILTVSPHSISATLYGYDFVINQYALTRRYLKDLQEHYQPGDVVKVKVRDLRIDNSTREISFTPDAITPELDDCRNRWYLFPVGSIGNAVISSIHHSANSNRVSINAWIKDYDLACKILYMDANSFGRNPVQGDSIQVVCAGYLPSGYVSVRCKALNGNAGLFYNF